MDRPFVLARGWSLAARLDFPLLITDAASSDNPDGGYEVGVGDLLVQGRFIHPLTERFAVAAACS